MVFNITPKTAGVEPFQVYMNSSGNSGGGAGTYNHGVWMGWNAGRFLIGGNVAGRPALIMGFEDD